MKRLLLTLALTTAVLTGCHDHHLAPIDYPPSEPDGLYSVTGDRKITLYWNANPENDIDVYAVYSSDRENGRYELEGVTENTHFTLYAENGVTLYLAVAAVDYAGQESELSYETVWDTPRPEGHNLPVFAFFDDDYQTNIDRCGVDFSDYKHIMIQALDNESNDVYVDNYNGVLFLNAFADDTDIAVIGPTTRLSDVDYIDPDQIDWDTEGYLALYEDYSYVIWTWDNHFATVRVQEVYQDIVLLEWAYQTDEGNPQLKVSGGFKAKNEKERKLKFRRPKKTGTSTINIIAK